MLLFLADLGKEFVTLTHPPPANCRTGKRETARKAVYAGSIPTLASSHPFRGLPVSSIPIRCRIGLPTALAAAQKLYGPTFNPEITLKALSYFDDGNLRALPEEMKSRLVVAAREVDVEHLPEITGIIGPKQQDYGIEL